MRNCMAAVVSRTLRVSGRSAANASSDVVALAKTTRAVVAATLGRYFASGYVAAGYLCDTWRQVASEHGAARGGEAWREVATYASV